MHVDTDTILCTDRAHTHAHAHAHTKTHVKTQRNTTDSAAAAALAAKYCSAASGQEQPVVTHVTSPMYCRKEGLN